MVTGNGMIAQRFSSYRDDDRFLIFASGVSDSSGATEADFLREKNLLETSLRENQEKILVYFSTCSIYDPSLQDAPYVVHKRMMEALIEESGNKYTIFRVSNPVGKTRNPHTVFNYFIKHIREHQHFTVWKYASRNLIDLDDMYAVCNAILQEAAFLLSKVNVANPINYPALSIVRAIENHFHVKAQFDTAEKGSSPHIDTAPIWHYFSKMKMDFNEQYLSLLLQKYFPVT